MERKIFHYRRNLYRQEIEVNSQLHIFFAGNTFMKKLIYQKQVSKELKQFFFFFTFAAFLPLLELV